MFRCTAGPSRRCSALWRFICGRTTGVGRASRLAICQRKSQAGRMPAPLLCDKKPALNLYPSPIRWEMDRLQQMCGIAGQLNFDGNEPVDLDTVRRMTRSIAHRGPDDEGYFFS